MSDTFIFHIGLQGGYLPSTSWVDDVGHDDRPAAVVILEHIHREVETMADSYPEDPSSGPAELQIAREWTELLAEIERDRANADRFDANAGFMYALPGHEMIECYPISEDDLKAAGWTSEDGFWTEP